MSTISISFPQQNQHHQHLPAANQVLIARTMLLNKQTAGSRQTTVSTAHVDDVEDGMSVFHHHQQQQRRPDVRELGSVGGLRSSHQHDDDVRSDYGGDDASPGSTDCSGGGGGSLSSRRMREFIPESKKDGEYWMKRQKNNEAAKRSREKRRANDAVMARRIHDLTTENKRLKLELLAVRRQFGLVSDAYFVQSEEPPRVLIASSSDDSVASPRSLELSAAEGSSGSDMPPSYGNLCHPSDAEFPLKPNDQYSSSLNDIATQYRPRSDYAAAKFDRSFNGGQCTAYSNHVAKSRSYSVDVPDYRFDVLYDDAKSVTSRARLKPSMIVDDSRRSSSVVVSDASSADESDSYESGDVRRTMSVQIPCQYPNGSTGRSTTGAEIPLNLSSASTAAMSGRESVYRFAADEMSLGEVRRQLSSRSWTDSSTSLHHHNPNLAEFSDGSYRNVVATASSGVDLSVVPRFVTLQSRTTAEMNPMTSPSLVPNYSRDPTTTAKLEPEKYGRTSSLSLPPVSEAFHSSLPFVRESLTSAAVTNPSASPSQTSTPQGLDQSFSFNGHQQVRRGVPLKVWHKLGAMRTEDCGGDQRRLIDQPTTQQPTQDSLPVSAGISPSQKDHSNACKPSFVTSESATVRLLGQREPSAGMMMKMDHGHRLIVAQSELSFPTYSDGASLHSSRLQVSAVLANRSLAL